MNAVVLSRRWDAAAIAAGVSHVKQLAIAAVVRERAAWLWSRPGMTTGRVSLYVTGSIGHRSSLMELSRAAGIDLPWSSLRQLCTLPRSRICAMRPAAEA